MKEFKITIIGNSIALRCRPHIEVDKNYGQLLVEKINMNHPEIHSSVNNTAFSRATVVDIHKILKDKIVNHTADFYIINLGVCDASTREIPFWFAEIINRKDDSLLRHAFSFIHKSIFKKNLNFFVKLRGKKTWISKSKFEQGMTEIISEVRKISNAPIVALSINLPDKRVEGLLPGSHDNYIEYNKVIKKLSSRHGLHFISMDDLNSVEHYPDGSHYSIDGHEIVANRILPIIMKELSTK